jgi:hypothetical protein
MNAGFTDPAIMSASFAPEARYPSHGMESFQQFNGGHGSIPHPPPGLTPAPDMAAHGESRPMYARAGKRASAAADSSL